MKSKEIKGLKLGDIVPNYTKSETFYQKLNGCRALLWIHGLLTDAESANAKARLLARARKEGYEIPQKAS
jgi:hypothetical protein